MLLIALLALFCLYHAAPMLLSATRARLARLGEAGVAGLALYLGGA
jgi:hypothetical protein